MSKYAGNVEHRIAPAAAEFTIPSASCIAGCENDGGEYPASQQYAQVGWEELGSVSPPGADLPQGCFYSARYEYGQGWRGGYLDRPGRDQTLEALFSDRVVVFDGHGAETFIQNQQGTEATTAASIRALRDQYGFASPAKFVLLECCNSGLNTPGSVANALEYVGVDCVIGWTINCPGSDPGYFELLDLMCNQGMSAAEAHSVVRADHVLTWMVGTRRIGDTELWGETL